jgi:O-antigen/teichoic acid export membrane protein
MTSIQDRMKLGIAWMIVARLVDRSIGIVSTLILARLLVPGDFGLVAMATAIIAALDLFGAFSFDLALIQNASAERKHYDTVWTFNVLFGLFCAFALLALAGPAATFYREPRLAEVMQVLAIGVAAGGFSNVGVVNFRKDLQFKREFLFLFIKRLSTFVVTIGSAVWLRSYWALLIGITVGRFANVLISYLMNAYRPSWNLSAAKELFGFSKWLLLNNTLFFLMHDGCTFIVGRFFGAAGLGIYSVAYEISNLPSSELVAPINRATFPGFSKMSDAREISEAYLKLQGMIALTILPAAIGIAAIAEPLVLTAFGVKWSEAIPLIQVLALYGAINATQTNNGPVWMALGNPHQIATVMLIFLACLFPALFFMMNKYGLKGAGYAYLLAYIPAVPYGTIVTKRMLGFGWAELVSALWRPVIAVAAMYYCVLAGDASFGEMNSIPRLALDIALGAFSYVAGVIVLWQLAGRPTGAESQAIGMLLRRVRRS